MQLAGQAVLTRAVVVEDAVCDVAALLYLGQQIAGAYGMDAPRGYEVCVAGV